MLASEFRSVFARTVRKVDVAPSDVRFCVYRRSPRRDTSLQKVAIEEIRMVWSWLRVAHLRRSQGARQEPHH